MHALPLDRPFLHMPLALALMASPALASVKIGRAHV